MVDLQVLREFAGSGIVGAIVGKAIYTSKISLASAIEEVK
jgi:phosphoribosylformimino-5-aminoimidazole carboxamide ribotide isomerase